MTGPKTPHPSDPFDETIEENVWDDEDEHWGEDDLLDPAGDDVTRDW